MDQTGTQAPGAPMATAGHMDRPSGMDRLGSQLASTLIFAILGMAILLLAYKIFDVINRLDFTKELGERNNALAIVLAGYFIAIAIIIGSTIHAP